jgi:SAM-dependent methyltransferase
VSGEGEAAWFQKSGNAYDRFMGRYGAELADPFLRWCGIAAPGRALDVGCGPGALTRRLAEVLGPENVAGADPSEPFVTVCRERVPGADVRVAGAEALPFEADSFDATLSQLAANFFPDAAAAMAEMQRVTRPGGLVAAAVWDYAGEMVMLRAFWDSAREVDPEGGVSHDEGLRMRLANTAELTELWSETGFESVETGAITISIGYRDFGDLWEPLLAGVGPVGAYCAQLSEEQREELREAYFRRLGSPAGSFDLSARAWVVRGSVAG